MTEPTVRVIIEKGIARIEALTADADVEVRDYDVELTPEDHPHLWTDENGRRCARYFVSGGTNTPPARSYAAGLEKLAADMGTFAGVSTSFSPAASEDLLHVLTVNGADFYFGTDGRYDGWGKSIQRSHSPPDA